MSQYLLYNGEFHLLQTAILHSHNRAFRYGDGLFESMRMMQGELRFAHLHVDRLIQAMKVLKMEGAYLFDEYFLKQQVAALAKKNKWGGNARLRLAVFRGGKGLYTPQNHQVEYILEGEELQGNEYTYNQQGLIVDVYDEHTKNLDKFANLKTSNALLYVLAASFKKQQGLDEAIILNAQGFVCETTSANIFVVYQKKIYTPALTEGCISGVMRAEVLALAAQHGMPVIEAQINPEILNVAEEVFLTNAAAGIQWVMGYGRRRYFNETSKKLHQLLNKRLL